MPDEKIILKRSTLRGEDGHKVFSIRIKKETYDKLDKICAETNHSRNELIGMFLDYAIEHCEIVDE